MKPNFCILSIVYALVVLAINQTVNAQSDNFLNYTNNDLKFSIQHPSNWLVVEDEKSSDERVWFKVSDRIMPIFVVQIHKVAPHNDTDMMSLKNLLQQYVQQRQDLLSSLDIDYNPVRQNNVTVGGNFGLKVEFTVGNFFTSDIFTIANGKFFEISYHDDPQSLPHNVELADRMVDSFQVIK